MSLILIDVTFDVLLHSTYNSLLKLNRSVPSYFSVMYIAMLDSVTSQNRYGLSDSEFHVGKLIQCLF